MSPKKAHGSPKRSHGPAKRPLGKRPATSPGRRPKRTRSAESTTSENDPRNAPGMLRLNKILAGAGLGSRRDVEELIVQGRVEIDRTVVTDLACKVDPKQVTIKVDGNVLRRERVVYYALNKPPGVLSTNKDPDGRLRVVDLVPDSQRVFSVGRLDRSSEGLILLTNDGDLAQRLAHPKFSVQKVYFVVVAGVMAREELDKLHKGVYLAEGFARIDGAEIKRQRKGCTELEITLSEGKNREIRRILARAGHKVVLLRRIAIGPLRLGQLPVGGARLLTSAEVKALYAITEQRTSKPKKKSAKKSAASDSTSTHAAQASSGSSRRAARTGTQPNAEEGAIDGSFSSRPGRVAKSGFDDDMDEFFSRPPRKTNAEDGEDWDDDELGGVGLNDADFEGDDFEDDDFNSNDLSDDDFVGHFAPSKPGSVLGYDDDGSTSPKGSDKPQRGRNTDRRPRSGATRGSTRSATNERGQAASADRPAVGAPKRASRGTANGPAGRAPAGRKGAGKRAGAKGRGGPGRPAGGPGKPRGGKGGKRPPRQR